MISLVVDGASTSRDFGDAFARKYDSVFNWIV